MTSARWQCEKYRRRSRRFVETLRSTDRRVLLLAQVLDRRGAIDPWNPPATQHARYCLERFGPERCSAAHFDAVYQLVRERYPELDFERIVLNYDSAQRPRSENVVYQTLPFVSLGIPRLFVDQALSAQAASVTPGKLASSRDRKEGCGRVGSAQAATRPPGWTSWCAW